MDAIIAGVNDILYTYLLIGLLAGAGLYFTVRSRAVQVRLAARTLRVLAGSRGGSEGGISSFQAFAIGIASRVGTGNIAGVAIALTLGGPGAIFWMWLIALLGMATAFVEATLAQMYKVRWHDGTFRGGPAFYIQRGLGSRTWGLVFAVALIFAFGLSFNMVQANTIAGTLEGAHGWPTWVTAILLVALTAPVVLGGIRPVARVTEVLAPVMAFFYVLLGLTVLVLNLPELPGVLGQIVAGAFGLDEALAGTAGGMLAALLNGVKRGLFSNEAGMGSAPNAAATATVRHPVQQGLIQSLGVFVDTMVVSSVTAFVILLAGPSVYRPGTTSDAVGATLTQGAVAAELGTWTTIPMTVLIFVFAFSSVLGNFTYAEVNMDFIRPGRAGNLALRLLVVASVAVGAVLQLSTVWSLADVAMGVMASINLVALFLLGRWALGAMRDYERQLGRGAEPTFVGVGNAELPGDLPTEVWRRRQDPAYDRVE